jgi:hypothetical protein
MKLMFKTEENRVEYQLIKRNKSFILLAYLTIVILNLAFRAIIPAHAGFYAPHDDTLGVRVAKNILDGNWLGQWDNLILAKPPGYSIYLSIAHIFPFEITVFNQILVCAIALLFSRLLHGIFLDQRKYGELVSFLCFTYIIFNPYFFSVEMSRVYRTSTHAIFILGFLVLGFSLFNCVNRFTSGLISFDTFKRRVRAHVISMALLYSFLILLRTESYWILLSTFSVGFVLCAVLYIQIREQKVKAKQLRNLAPAMLLLSVVAYLVPISFIGQLNNTKYGSSLIENYYSGNFANAIKDWQRVEEGKDPRAYIVVSNEQRSAVYKISPSAASLKPYLDLRPGESWLGQACNSPIRLCDNSGAWFPWFLRDAVISSGLVSNESDFQNFFRQISVDIKKACENGKLTCGPIGLGVGAKPLMDLPFKTIFSYSLDNSLDVLKSSMTPNGSVSNPDQFGAPTDVIQMYHEVVNYDLNESQQGVKPNYAWELDFLQRAFSWINGLAYVLALLGYLFAWKHRNRKLIFGALGLGIVSFAICLVGVSIAQVSFGWRSEGPYLLPLFPILQFLTLVGMMSLISLIGQPSVTRKSEK